MAMYLNILKPQKLVGNRGFYIAIKNSPFFVLQYIIQFPLIYYHQPHKTLSSFLYVSLAQNTCKFCSLSTGNLV